MDLAVLLFLVVGQSAVLSPEDAGAYAAARSAYLDGKFDAAEEGFASLVKRGSPLSPFARFGLANVQVRRADAAAGEERRRLLLSAIGEYRALLDGLPAAGLRAEDVRFNLEIAKRSIPSGETREKGTRIEAGSGERKEPSTSQGERPDDRPEKSDRPIEGSKKSEKGSGAVERPLLGAVAEDSGPLSPELAGAILEKARKRIAKAKAARSKLDRARRPHLRNDF